jgi:hypothetical protein
LIGPYETPQAFRAALEARLTSLAQNRGIDLQRLRRHVAFERLLARLFAEDDPPWLLKGGYALELRLEGRARSTLDLDLSVPDSDCLQLMAKADGDVSCAQAVYDQLQVAAGQNLHDGFEFLVDRPREGHTGAPLGGFRCSVDARLAGRTFARFHLDIGLGDAVLQRPDWMEGSRLLSFAGIDPTRVGPFSRSAAVR